MTNTIFKKTILATIIVIAFVAGSITTGTVVFADDDDNEGGSLLCPVGQAMTGILFEDDDEILDVICGAQLQGPQIFRVTDQIVVPVGDSQMLEVTCGAGETFLDNSQVINSNPLRPTTAPFIGLGSGPVQVNNANGNFGQEATVGWRIQVQNTIGFPSDFTVEVSIACVRP